MFWKVSNPSIGVQTPNLKLRFGDHNCFWLTIFLQTWTAYFECGALKLAQFKENSCLPSNQPRCGIYLELCKCRSNVFFALCTLCEWGSVCDAMQQIKKKRLLNSVHNECSNSSRNNMETIVAEQSVHTTTATAAENGIFFSIFRITTRPSACVDE